VSPVITAAEASSKESPAGFSMTWAAGASGRLEAARPPRA
jgi:hypothetical protein